MKDELKTKEDIVTAISSSDLCEIVVQVHMPSVYHVTEL
jgi:hypothetical protein